MLPHSDTQPFIFRKPDAARALKDSWSIFSDSTFGSRH